ncbi:MAG: RecT family recombinase [Pseudomonadota bacterium]
MTRKTTKPAHNKPRTAVETAFTLVEPARQAFTALLCDKTPEQGEAAFQREAAFAIQLLADSKNGYSLQAGLENPGSVIDALVHVAAMGISLNPATRQAYLVPRNGRICLDISYMGLVDLATSTGAIRWAKAHVVHEADVFRLHGYDKAPTHDYPPFAKDRGHIVGVYVVAKTADGDFITHTMTMDEVFDIRDRSEAWKAWLEREKTCPWVTDENEMAKKTCVKQASKSWPRDPSNSPLDKAIDYLNNEGGEGLDFGGNSQPDASALPAQPEIRMPVRKAPPSKPAAQPAPTDLSFSPTKATEVQNQTPQTRPATEGEKSHIRIKAGQRLQELLACCGIASMEQLTSTEFAQLRSRLKELA